MLEMSSQMKEAKELVDAESDGLTGVTTVLWRTFPAHSGHRLTGLLPPPHFGEHTDEIVLLNK
jgi:hypothetical protein